MLEPWAQSLPPAAYALIRDGYLAVSIFFVLSGFVLAQSYGATNWTRESLLRYARGRFARVYPVYALSLLIVSPYISLSQAPHKSALIANYVLLLQGWTGTLPVQWNTPAWSLSCEMLFYLCFPLAALTIRKLSGRAAIVAALVTCFLPAALWHLGVPDSYKPLIHLADFLIGILAARAFRALRPRMAGRGYCLYLAGIAAIAALMLHPFYIPAVLDLNGFLRPFTALTLIGFALAGGYPARILSTRVPVFLGKASYAVYILHIPLLWSYKRWAPYWFPGLSGTAMACIYIAGVVVVSAIVYRLLEEPANRYLRFTSPLQPIAPLAREASETRAVAGSDSVRSSTCVLT
jgi:peptidoglycan/LPS O-acetylase OafA/YrhL